MNSKAKYYIGKLNLQPHPEGGWFKEIYRAGEIITGDYLPERYKSSRNFSTSIYFLLEGKQVSTFHKLKSDEVWHFYDGSSAGIYILSMEGVLTKKIIGKTLEEGEEPQVIIPQNNWFAAEVNDKDSFIFVGCTVSPGFDFTDFELGVRQNLLKDYPGQKELVTRFTRAK